MANAPLATTEIDHLVVAATTLAEGVAWCEDTLGLTPGPGGEHQLMGTHNRLFSIASPAHPRAYFEIIAINPNAPPPHRRRWFDLDDPALSDRLRRNGPEMVHFVARVPNAHKAVHALVEIGMDSGEVIVASRPTPAGLLQWQITVREDGRRLFDGAMPTLIEWGEVHPADSLPDRGLRLHQLTVRHPEADRLRAAYQVIGLTDVSVQAEAACLEAVLESASGRITLTSNPIAGHS